MIIVFDLDDTLYPEMEFVRSGFWTVACAVAPDEPVAVYQHLLQILARHGSGQVFNRFAEESGRAVDIPELVKLYRFHSPRIQLDVETQVVLEHCAAHHPTALLTDGPYEMQWNKFRALQLERWIDFPVFTDQMGTSKPDKRPFQAIMQQYGESETYVYIADNPRKDFIAPQQLGWHSVRLRRVGGVYAALDATVDHEIASLFDMLPLIASMKTAPKNSESILG